MVLPNIVIISQWSFAAKIYQNGITQFNSPGGYESRLALSTICTYHVSRFFHMVAMDFVCFSRPYRFVWRACWPPCFLWRKWRSRSSSSGSNPWKAGRPQLSPSSRVRRIMNFTNHQLSITEWSGGFLWISLLSRYLSVAQHIQWEVIEQWHLCPVFVLAPRASSFVSIRCQMLMSVNFCGPGPGLLAKFGKWQAEQRPRAWKILSPPSVSQLQNWATHSPCQLDHHLEISVWPSCCAKSTGCVWLSTKTSLMVTWRGVSALPEWSITNVMPT